MKELMNQPQAPALLLALWLLVDQLLRWVPVLPEHQKLQVFLVHPETKINATFKLLLQFNH